MYVYRTGASEIEQVKLTIVIDGREVAWITTRDNALKIGDFFRDVMKKHFETMLDATVVAAVGSDQITFRVSSLSAFWHKPHE